MGIKYIKVKKAETLNGKSNKARIQTIKNFYNSEKFERLTTEKKSLLEKSIYQISKGQKARKSSTKTKYRQQIKKSFIKLFDIKFDKTQKKGIQKDRSVGGFKNLAGVSGIEIETTRFEKVSRRTAYNMIHDFKTFLLNYEFDVRPTLDEGNVITYFDNFVSDTDSGGARRVMTRIGVADTISRQEFYEGLKKAEIIRKEQK